MIRSKKKKVHLVIRCYCLFSAAKKKKNIINIEYLLFIIYFVVIKLVDNVFNKVTGHYHQSLTLIKITLFFFRSFFSSKIILYSYYIVKIQFFFFHFFAFSK